MTILLWLVPAVVVTVAAMIWVSWLGRAGRGRIDRDEAVARLGTALEAPGGRGRQRRSRPTPGYAVVRSPRERSTGVAVRETPAQQRAPRAS